LNVPKKLEYVKSYQQSSGQTGSLPASRAILQMERKEVNAMTYTKPEIVTVGDATRIIQGGQKGIGSESVTPKTQRKPAYSELDD